MLPKFEPADQNLPSPATVTLREYLTNRFQMIELETIAHDLGIDPQTLRHATISELVLDLITRCQHSEQVPELMAVAQEMRPETRKIPTLRQLAELKLDLGEQREDKLILVLSCSYDELDEAARARFRALGTLAAHPFDLPMLAALWAVDEVLKGYKQALPLYQIIKDQSGEALNLNRLGKLHMELGKEKEALKYFEKSLPLFQAVGDRSNEATTFYNLGSVYYTLGQLNKAVESLARCVEIEEQVEHPYLVSHQAIRARLRAKLARGK